MTYSRFAISASALLLVPLLFFFSALGTSQAVIIPEDRADGATTDAGNDSEASFSARLSNRIIVELSSPPLAVAQEGLVSAAGASAQLDVHASSAQAYLAQLQAEQATFVSALSVALPDATVGQSINEYGEARESSYQIVFNGITIDPGSMDQAEAMVLLQAMPSVKAVYPNRAYTPLLYESAALIHAPEVWNLPEIDGMENAGRGIRIASVDTGVHHAAPMFDGTGYAYPPDMPDGGYGYKENNNGKIIVSRAYFRDWDPPLEGEQYGWPGPFGSSHGTHTSSTAAGDWVTTTVPSVGVRSFAGIAPKAYVMSYKVGYEGTYQMPFFFNEEMLMALDDAVRDGADIINNSWGGGPGSSGGKFDAIDTALINATKAGVFVSMSTGNAGPGTGTADHPSTDYINVAAGEGTLIGNQVVGTVTEFSSRGPGVGNVLKPDIIAPGKNIFAQGYGPSEGEARHLGFGAVSGTSMAAPHVSGAAALIMQLHPDWSNQMIKSALMSTAQFIGITRKEDGMPAQPLDMGAGWINVAAALDPGVILDPPSLSFGLVPTNTEKTLSFSVRNITNVTETYTVTSLYTGQGFVNPPSLPGFTTEPVSITVAPGGSAFITVTFDAATGRGYGDNQGYILLTGDEHEAHLPAWGRVSYSSPIADVLLLDNDGSESNGTLYVDTANVYANALDALGYSYQIHAINKQGASPTTVPNATELMAYKAVILFTGTNGSSAFLTQSFTEPEMDRLVEYLNNGGALIVMGSNVARIMLANQTDYLSAPYLYAYVLKANWIQSSVTKGAQPTTPLRATGQGPLSMNSLLINTLDPGMDEIDYRYHNGWPIVYGGTPLLYYPGAGPDYGGAVSMLDREQPAIDRQGITYLGRTLYTTFGLESVDDSAAPFGTSRAITRTALMETFLDWVWSEPPAVALAVSAPTTITESYLFTATVSGVENQVGVQNENATKVDSVRWDFADGKGVTEPSAAQTVERDFLFCGPYTVTVEVTDWNDNVAVLDQDFEVTENCVVPRKTFLPLFVDR